MAFFFFGTMITYFLSFYFKFCSCLDVINWKKIVLFLYSEKCFELYDTALILMWSWLWCVWLQ